MNPDLTETISVTEVLWLIITMWGMFYHYIRWRRAIFDMAAINLHQIKLSRGSRALMKISVWQERDRMILKAILFLIGTVSLFRENAVQTTLGWISVGLLFLLVVYLDITSWEMERMRRRAGIGVDG